MKTTYLILFLLLFNNSYAQYWPQHIITEGYPCSDSVTPCDIDGDGDMDVITEDRDLVEHILRSYRNDGEGNFEFLQLIVNLHGDSSIFTSDLDNDGDLDVITAYVDKLQWSENIGDGIFDAPQIITPIGSVLGPIDVYACDLDGDEDMDVISTSYSDDKIAWYENDGSGNFGSQQIISSDYNEPRTIYAIDMDDDDDLDVLTGLNGDGKIIWHENDGLGNFVNNQIIYESNNGIIDILAADLDSDEDIDVLLLESGGKISWNENDGNGNFSNHFIDIDYGASNLQVADINNDGLLEVIGVDDNFHEIHYYLNDGEGNFNWLDRVVIAQEVYYTSNVNVADIDGDEDIDVLSGTVSLVGVTWHENLNIFSINDNSLIEISVLPNPANEVLIIINQDDYLIFSIQVYDLLGRLVLEETDNFNQLNISKLETLCDEYQFKSLG